MALLKCFQKQSEKKPCPVCGHLVTRGMYRSHLTCCKLQPDDDDCQIVAEVCAKDRKRDAAESVISSDSSDDLFRTVDDDKTVVESYDEDKNAKCLFLDVIAGTSAGANEQKQVVETVADEKIKVEMCNETPSSSTRKRPKRIEIIVDNPEIFPSKSTTEMENIDEVALHLPTSPKNRSESEMSMSKKVKSETEEVSRDENEKRDFSYCETTTSHETEKQNLHDTLENIRSYLDVCDCNLAKNVHILSNHDDSMGDNTQIGSPYYLILFHKILKRVFYSESQYGDVQFWGERLHLIEKFIALSDGSKQLLIRLFLRKRRWLIADKLSYSNICSSLNPLFEELLQAEFVDSSRSSLLEIEEAVHLLHASSLKSVAKHFKLDFNKGKSDICRSLLKFATQKNVFGITMTKRVLHKIKEELGPCFRIRKKVVDIFSAIFTIYSPLDMSSTLLFDQPSINLPSQLLFVLLQLGTDKLRFPAPCSPCLISIYTDAEKLFRYVKAKNLEAKIADLTHRGKWIEIIDCAKKARIEFQNAYTQQWQFYESLLVDLLRFTDLHVYARCISHGVEALERVRDYTEAVAWLEYMLNAVEFKLILANSRGGWWDRLALNLDAHLKDRNRAMKAVIAGLEDPVLGDKDRLSLQNFSAGRSLVMLQDRGRKLCNGWKGPIGEVDPERIDIRGSVVGKNLGDGRINRFFIKRNGVFCECSVEDVALNHYLRKKGFKEGVHAEGAIWHTIFGLLFYDIIFDHAVKNVWFSETQTNPADLNSRTFYTNRQDLFELRFSEIEEADLDDLLIEMERTYNSYYGVTNSEIAWNCFTDFEQVKRFMSCCPITVLCATIRRLIMDYRNCRSGFPDLTVWNNEKKLLAVVEVKGPGDKLSTKQRLWLNFFKSQNITAHVCHVSARNLKKLD